MVWKGSSGDRSLYWARWNPASRKWNPQQVIGGTASVASPAVCRDLDLNQVRIMWRGSEDDDSLYTTTLSGLFWQPQTPVSWIVPGNGLEGTVEIEKPGSADGPEITFVGNRIVAAWRGVPGDSSLWFTQYASGRVGGSTVNEWSSQAAIPGVGSARGPALAHFKGRLRLVWRGIDDDNGLWTATL
jgi:hypothetical protein